jgi:hypothetical protein
VPGIARADFRLVTPRFLGLSRRHRHQSNASRRVVRPSGYGHLGLTFSSELKARRFDPASGHHMFGVHSDDPAGYVIIRPRRLSVIGRSVTPRHV